MNGRPSTPASGKTRRGAADSCRASVLVIVLVTLLFASVAVVAFIEKAGDDLTVAARDSAARRLRAEAYSALEVTLAVLEDFRQTNNGLRSPAEGWSDPLGFAGWSPREGCTVDVTFEDESGKLSLPHIDTATFLNLFESWGLSEPDSERLSDALQSWMQKDHVSASARMPDYESGALPYMAPFRSLRSYSELAAIDYAREVFYDKEGQPNDLYRRFVSTISLLDFKQTNLNSATGDVVTALGSLDRSQEQQLGDYLHGSGSRAQEGPAFFESTSEAAGVLGTQTLPAGYGTEISALRINIVVHEGRTLFRVSTVVAPSGGGATLVRPVPPEQSSSTIGGDTQTRSQLTSGPSTSEAASGSSASGTTPAKKLNYPFTLLEIKENAEISTVPPPSTKA